MPTTRVPRHWARGRIEARLQTTPQCDDAFPPRSRERGPVEATVTDHFKTSQPGSIQNQPLREGQIWPSTWLRPVQCRKQASKTNSEKNLVAVAAGGELGG